MEFAEYGNLHESSAQRSIGRLCKFTIQAATALEHLEAKNVIHQSVKSFNCLVVARDQVSPAASQSACPGHSCSLFNIARSGVQMETGDECLNFHLIRNWSPSQERSH